MHSVSMYPSLAPSPPPSWMPPPARRIGQMARPSHSLTLMDKPSDSQFNVDFAALIRELVALEVQAALESRGDHRALDVVVVDQRRLYSVAQVAELLGTGTDYVYDRIKSRVFPIVELGDTKSKQRIRADDLQKFKDARTFGEPGV
jgi:excisionase family DNA binding protein